MSSQKFHAYQIIQSILLMKSIQVCYYLFVNSFLLMSSSNNNSYAFTSDARAIDIARTEKHKLDCDNSENTDMSTVYLIGKHKHLFFSFEFRCSESSKIIIFQMLMMMCFLKKTKTANLGSWDQDESHGAQPEGRKMKKKARKKKKQPKLCWVTVRSVNAATKVRYGSPLLSVLNV